MRVVFGGFKVDSDCEVVGSNRCLGFLFELLIESSKFGEV